MDVPNAITPKQAVDRLTEMGYFKFLSDSDCAAAQTELAASLSRGYWGYDWDDKCVSRDKRSYPADGEDLAEGRVGEFIELMQDALAHVGVSFHSIEDVFDYDSENQEYDVVIDGQRYPIHDTNILETWDSWAIATKRYLEIVNELLEAKESSERLYGINGGNDGRSILLTHEMFEFLKSSGLISDPLERPFPSSDIYRN